MHELTLSLSNPLVLRRLRYGTHGTDMQLLLAKKEEEEAVVPEKVVPWSEPDTLNLLLDRYIVEGKFSGRTPGTTLYLVQACNRAGHVDQCTPDQRFKLFMVTWLIVSRWYPSHLTCQCHVNKIDPLSLLAKLSLTRYRIARWKFLLWIIRLPTELPSLSLLRKWRSSSCKAKAVLLANLHCFRSCILFNQHCCCMIKFNDLIVTIYDL